MDGCERYVIKKVENNVFRFRVRRKMANNHNRTVYQRDDGSWVNKRNDADRASSVHETQKEAEQAAREMLKNQGGGELSIMGLDGKIRSKHTISPAKDPYPPKG